MAKYFKGQTWQADIFVPVDITGAGTNQIKYRKPSGATGAWTATVVDAEAAEKPPLEVGRVLRRGQA